MRFAVTYKVDQIDLMYRMKVYSLIKEAVRLGDPRYFEQYFKQSEGKMKCFSFATYLHNFNIKKDVINLEHITVTISSPDVEFALHAFNGIRKLREYKVGDKVWKFMNIQLLKEHAITNKKVIFRTISPLLIEDKNGNPLPPTDANYETELNYYANLQINQFANRNLFEPLSFTPLNMKKIVIKETNRHLMSNRFLYFTTYKGMLMLEGNPNDLQLIYQMGLGKRNTYFGLLDYEHEEV